MRLFIAINFPIETNKRLAEICAGLRRAAVRGNFTLEDNFHLTLVFIGECGEERAKAAKAVIDRADFPPFSLTINRVDLFRHTGGDIYWAGFKRSAPLNILQSFLTDNLRRAGFILENRNYTPHVTLGRGAVFPAGFQISKLEPICFTAGAVELMKSERMGGRQVYTAVYGKTLK